MINKMELRKVSTYSLTVVICLYLICGCYATLDDGSFITGEENRNSYFVCFFIGVKQKWNYVNVRKNAHMFWWLYYTREADKPLVLWLQVCF